MKSRLFVGVPLPSGVVVSLSKAADVVRREDARWSGEKWVAAENLHVTLAFLGDVDESVLGPLIGEIGDEVSFAVPLTLSPTAISAVPSRRNCRMLWASFEDMDEGAAVLAESIHRRVAGFGIAVDEKPFRAHVTLCRARRPHPIDGAAVVAAEQAFLAGATVMSDPPITLFSSRLTPRGPHYGEIATWHTLGECDR